MLAAATASASQEPVKYIGADGTEKEATEYTVLDDMTIQEGQYGNVSLTLSAGTYVVKNDVSLRSRNSTAYIFLKGDVELIICDGASLSLESPNGGISGTGSEWNEQEKDFIFYHYSLTVYSQHQGTGKLIINYGAIQVKDFNFYGGELDVTGEASGKTAIISYGNVNIAGGHVSLKGSSGSWSFQTLDGYVKATGTSNQNFTLTDTVNEFSQWTVSFSGGLADIKNVKYTSMAIQ